jgi:acetoin utilization deacetylase AcuC-like enzyme
MTLLYSNPCFLDHKTGAHPENPARLEAIEKRLRETGVDQQCQRPASPPASLERIHRVHLPQYVEVIEEFADEGGGHIEADTIISRNSYKVALRAVGAACDAVENVLRGNDKNALCLIRPPGHHCRKYHAMGFCLLNNVAIAARVATAEFDLDRVLIVDYDVHHGNGTQETFWEDGQVGFLSMHRWPFYPGTGADDETGAGDGVGATLNLPVAFGTRPEEQVKAFQDELTRLADKIQPQLVLLSAGFDTHRDDPVGSLGLDFEHIDQLTNIVLDVADAHADGRVVSVLEGGYNPPDLARCVEDLARSLLARSESSAGS